MFEDCAIETLAEFSQVRIVKLFKFNRSEIYVATTNISESQKQQPTFDSLRGEATTDLG